MFRVTISTTANRAMRRIPAAVAQRIVARIEAIARDPLARHNQVKRLKGVKDRFRLRVGNWRALYRIDRETRTLLVLDVRKREEAYG